ncbi:MAG: hypothetical protein U9R31_04225 [Candidatus Omnitrophota bacterium]|nr:hypothetical protein [Candidatus Omnitrophota bacterium]
MRRVIIYSSLFVLLFVFIMPGDVFAVRFNVSPSRIELIVNPGEKKNSYITISNSRSQVPINVKAYVEDVINAPDGEIDFLPPGTTPWSCAEWIKLKPDGFTLAPGQEQVVKLQVKVPPKARGGYYGITFFEVLIPSTKSGGIQTSTALRIGAVVLIDIAGTTEYKAKLTQLRGVNLEKEGVVTSKVSCMIKNLGNLLIRPKGTIQILNVHQEEQEILELNPEKGGILPGMSRTFTVTCKETLGEGQYVIRALIDYGGKELLGGQASFINK